jgi:hypothetical protein
MEVKMVTQTMEAKVSLTGEKAQIITKALDKLGIALAVHNHQWTDEERRLYERAVAILTS